MVWIGVEIENSDPNGRSILIQRHDLGIGRVWKEN